MIKPDVWNQLTLSEPSYNRAFEKLEEIVPSNKREEDSQDRLLNLKGWSAEAIADQLVGKTRRLAQRVSPYDPPDIEFMQRHRLFTLKRPFIDITGLGVEIESWDSPWSEILTDSFSRLSVGEVVLGLPLNVLDLFMFVLNQTTAKKLTGLKLTDLNVGLNIC